jgi:hypothetical protein
MRYFCISILLVVHAAPTSAENRISLERSERGVTVRVDDSLFAEYLTRSGRQPVIWPIIGPTEEAYTRAFPVGPPQEMEAKDHLHHQSLWFAHGDVNGFDFWNNAQRNSTCEILHREFVKVESDQTTATLVTRNDWIASGKKQCEDLRTIVFGADDSARWIDFTIRLIASAGDVQFGDTKEGSFATRVAGTMKVDPPGQGQIVNSRDQHDQAAWGQPAEWVDYSGPVKGETVGIAILSHPSNFRHPCRWHVRTYGLFAANPFGESDFPSGEVRQGEFLLPAGETLTLRYRALFHRGDQQTANIQKKYQSFAQEAAPARAVP